VSLEQRHCKKKRGEKQKNSKNGEDPAGHWRTGKKGQFIEGAKKSPIHFRGAITVKIRGELRGGNAGPHPKGAKGKKKARMESTKSLSEKK